MLKDASAAIYGVRTANGVVVVVTAKRGKMGAPSTINVDAYTGWQNWTRFPKNVNAGLLFNGNYKLIIPASQGPFSSVTDKTTNTARQHQFATHDTRCGAVAENRICPYWVKNSWCRRYALLAGTGDKPVKIDEQTLRHARRFSGGLFYTSSFRFLSLVR